jgi:hypothetical protein
MARVPQQQSAREHRQLGQSVRQVREQAAQLARVAAAESGESVRRQALAQVEREASGPTEPP